MTRTRVALAVCGLLLATRPVATAPDFKVIVNAGVTGKTIKKAALAEVFLRRTQKWGDGTPIRPVDQLSNSPVRLAFNRDILGFSALDVQQYWVAQISKGTPPPPVMKSEAQVIAFVAGNPGAVGYVSDATSLPETVRVLEVE